MIRAIESQRKQEVGLLKPTKMKGNISRLTELLMQWFAPEFAIAVFWPFFFFQERERLKEEKKMEKKLQREKKLVRENLKLFQLIVLCIKLQYRFSKPWSNNINFSLRAPVCLSNLNAVLLFTCTGAKEKGDDFSPWTEKASRRYGSKG